MIRHLTERDEALFCTLSDEFYHSDGVLHPVPKEHFHRAFSEMMRSRDYLDCFIIESGGEAAGYGLLVKSYSQEAGGVVVWLDELYIRPEFQSRGLGSEFFGYVFEHYPAARYRLEIEPDNDRARALYERLGFEALPYCQMIREEAD